MSRSRLIRRSAQRRRTWSPATFLRRSRRASGATGGSRIGGAPPALVLPLALILFFGFQAGGFFPGAPAVAAVILIAALIVRLLVAPRPFDGAGPAFALGAGALALYAAWTLVSALWSHAPSRALIEFDRALVYLLAFVLAGSVRRTPERMRWIVRGAATGFTVVAAAGLLTRMLPDVFPIASGTLDNTRLSFPLTYWNALGLLAALGLVLCASLASSTREPPASRILASAAFPVLGATLLLTFSRGAIAVGIAGLVTYVVVARPHGLLSALLAAGPTTAIAVVAAARADRLASDHPATAAAAAQGHRLALVVAGCVLATALLRLLALWLDARLARLRLPEALARPLVTRGAAVALVIVVVAAGVAAGLPGVASRAYHGFVSGNELPATSGVGRLAQTGNNGRIAGWKVAVHGFDSAPVHGLGAGTYELRWNRYRPSLLMLTNAHNLYLETMDELGVVGLALLVVALGVILGGLAWRARGRDRALYAGLLAAALMWVVHAGVDWDWQMPAVTAWLFVVGGAALARAPSTQPAGDRRRLAEAPRLARVVIGLCAALLAVTPAEVALSQANLNASLNAFHQGDCTRASQRALASIGDLGSRPEPYEVLGYCDARGGYGGLAIKQMRQAVASDPDNWEMRYGLALVRAASGVDPRGAARAALRLDPREPLAQGAVEAFAGTSDPRKWKRRAQRARLPN